MGLNTKSLPGAESQLNRKTDVCNFEKIFSKKVQK